VLNKIIILSYLILSYPFFLSVRNAIPAMSRTATIAPIFDVNGGLNDPAAYTAASVLILQHNMT
jgi:hypothetical protein